MPHHISIKRLFKISDPLIESSRLGLQHRRSAWWRSDGPRTGRAGHRIKPVDRVNVSLKESLASTLMLNRSAGVAALSSRLRTAQILSRFSAGAFFLRMENCNSLRVIGQTALLMDKNVEKHLSDTYAAQGIKVHL